MVRVADRRVAGCTECNRCFRTGRCVIEDDYQRLYDRLIGCDAVVVATPVFFMSVPAQLKAVIDRTQCLWARRYVLGEPVGEPGGRRPGALLVVGGSKSEKMFESVRLTVHYFFDALGVTLRESLFADRLDERGAVRKRPELLQRARQLGRRLLSGPSSEGRAPPAGTGPRAG